MAGTSRPTDWILHIEELLRRDDLEAALETPTSIFKLPESKTKDNPQAYSPCRVFLGPYQEMRPELHKMEILKLENAKKAKQKFELPEFTEMVEQLKELDVQIRACYGQNLPMGSQALAWRILIDGLFFLRLLGIYPNDNQDKGKVYDSDRFEFELPVFNEQRLYLNSEENITTTQNEIAKDLLKLENQIPIQALKMVLPKNLFKENLPLLFYKFCASVSPLSLPPLDNPNFLASHNGWFPNLCGILDQSQHLLHFLYTLFLYKRYLAFQQPLQQRSDLFSLSC
ncbi:putative UPF0481 protein At3g02645 [Momordica charantia]|uniref:UPF0481 protein At3g02645 n=1 Tax=Momordica charantia TaxID=3673 RepID=A0A6J1DA48_MOMCH|nr:putative UPF0481 protein At3g02645 [Momordica charantia]